MKRNFVVTLILSFLLSSFALGATVESENISGNSGDTIKVPVYVKSDNGLCGFGINVRYDNSVLEPIACNNEGFNGMFASNLEYASNSVMIVGADSLNSQSGRFKLFTAEFKIKDNVKSGNYNIDIIIDEASTLRNGEVVFDTTGSTNCTVSVKGIENVEVKPSAPQIETKCDIDGDGTITKEDAEELLNYVLKGNGTKIDLTYDSIIDSNDVAYILKRVK